jgi:hypothetical protein
MGSQNSPPSFRSIKDTAGGVSRRELRVYRTNGALSMIYVMAVGSDAKALVEARKIARCGYQVEIWRDEVRIDWVSELDGLDKSEGQSHV